MKATLIIIDDFGEVPADVWLTLSARMDFAALEGCGALDEDDVELFSGQLGTYEYPTLPAKLEFESVQHTHTEPYYRRFERKRRPR